MYPLQLLFVSSLAALVATEETVYGVYVFHRHGDRTPKSLPPANLTTLGYQEILTAGQYFRNRYVSSGASLKLQGLSSDVAIPSQLTVTAPSDTVLQDSAQAFLQGLYPPVSGRSETLRNGTIIQAPMNGYQLVPIGLTTSGSGNEDNGWLQEASGCTNAAISSNNYFLSAEYQQHLSSTQEFYKRLEPVVNGTFASSATNFKNAYTIFDLINVAEIHNATINNSDLLDNSTLLQLRTLADAHEWGLAYNSSDTLRALPGMQLAGEIAAFFNTSISRPGKAPKLGVQFGAYATFLSFFGLTDLPAASADFHGVPDYASAMVFELYADGAPGGPVPAPRDLNVRFLFHNGSSSNASEPKPFPLFGSGKESMAWLEFQDRIDAIAVRSTADWCAKCGNTTGSCAAYANGSASAQGGGAANGQGKSGMSAAVGGVIGAFVTLAVVLGLEALVVLLGGLRLVKKRSGSPVGSVGGAAKA
jgi:hypothetical protein